MKIKHLSLLVLSAAVVSACSTTSKKVEAPQAIVFEEPAVSPAFYALNPYDYNKPPEFEVNLYKASVAPVQPMKVNLTPEDPNAKEVILDKNRFIIPLTNSNVSNMRFGVLANNNELDVTDIDDFLNILEGKARHYPTQFASNSEKAGYRDKLKEVLAKLEPKAQQPDASYDVQIRTLKAAAMARNMDMGDSYGPKTLDYARKILAKSPNDPTANFWLGFSLAEGGGFKEGLPYLQKAMNSGIQEAYLSVANTYLYMGQRKNALTTLNNYKIKYTTEAATIDKLVEEIKAGQRYNVWQTAKQ